MRYSLSFLWSLAMAAQILVITGCGDAKTVSTASSGSGAGSGSGTGSTSGSSGGSSSGTGSSAGSSSGSGSAPTSGSGSSSGSGSGSTSGSGSGTTSGSGSGSTGGSSSSTGSTSNTTRPEFLYAVASQQQGRVYEFQIDTMTGAFSAISGSPFSADVGNPTYVCTNECFASLVADPLGRFLYYQYNYGGSSVTNALDSLAVNPTTGALNSAGKYSQPVYQLAADPLGRYVYWNQSGGLNNAIGGLAVSSTGALTPTPGQPYVYDGQVSYGAPAITSNYVFALTYMTSSGGTGSLYEWTIDAATGTLTRTGNTMPVDKGAAPAVTPDGKFLYVEEFYLKNGIGYWQIVPIQIAANGGFIKLEQFAQQTPLQGDSPMLISPDGNFLYISVYGNIWLFKINKTTGELTLVHKYTEFMANLLALDPAGKFLFASPEGTNQIASTTLTAYSVNSTTGELTPVANSTVDLKAIPIALAVVSPPAKQ